MQPELTQVIVSVAVVGRSRNDVVFPGKAIDHADRLKAAHAELDLLLAQDAVDHRRAFLDDVVLDGIVIEHPETGVVDRHLHFVDKLPVVEIDGLHGGSIHLTVEKQVGFGDGLALEVVKESLAARLLADKIDQPHAQQKYSSNDNRILQRKSGSYLHNLSLRMKPTPGLVWMSLTSNVLSIFLRR